MLIYLMRHAIAVERGNEAYLDDDRPLTDKGKRKMSEASGGMVSLIRDIDLILTSPLKRAHETALIAARALKAEHKLQICKELASGSSLKNLLTHVGKHRDLHSLMLIGHEPDLGFLATALLGYEGSIIEFKKGSICCIDASSLPPRSKGTVLWHLQPKHLRALS